MSILPTRPSDIESLVNSGSFDHGKGVITAVSGVDGNGYGTPSGITYSVFLIGHSENQEVSGVVPNNPRYPDTVGSTGIEVQAAPTGSLCHWYRVGSTLYFHIDELLKLSECPE
jgi:hypothetical protein